MLKRKREENEFVAKKYFSEHELIEKSPTIGELASKTKCIFIKSVTFCCLVFANKFI